MVTPPIFTALAAIACLVFNPQAELGSIMPTGNSITEGDYSSDWLGFRRPLYELLVAQGHDFTFVGDTIGDAGDERYPGHFRGGSRIEEFYPPGFGNGWGTGSFDIGPVLRDLHPDIILIHLGTNNMPQQTTPLGPYSFDGGATLHESYAGYMAELLMYIVEQYDGYPSETPLIVLSLIIPMRGIVARVAQYNGYLEELALDMAYGQVTGDPLHVVTCDHFTPFIENPLLFTGEPGDYMFDAAHPNDLGYSVMAETYLSSLMDETPPAPVTDLTVWGQGAHNAKLWWTASGDDILSGTASVVEFRFFRDPILDEQLFSQSWELVPHMESIPGGSVQQLIAGGLAGGEEYWFALKIVDDAGNVSEISNSPSVRISLCDSLVEEFDEEPLPSVWALGPHYFVDNGMLKPANPQPIWLPPAVFVGESSPWESELELPVVCPPGETNLAGLVVAADAPDQAVDGYVVFYEDGIVRLRILESGVLGAVIDTATSRYGQLAPGDRLGVLPFDFKGELLIRVMRNGSPDRVLDTGAPVFQIPTPRYAGVIMRGGLGWGIERFRLGGPGLWEAPQPFHLLSPDSGAVVEDPPLLTWDQSSDPDPWDAISYSVIWSTLPGFPVEDTYEILCESDTSHAFPSDEFIQGETYYWRVRATDSMGLETLSIEQDWCFTASTNHSPSAFALIYPAHGESITTRSPVLLWSSSTDPDDDAITYTVAADLDSTLLNPSVLVEGVTDTFVQVGPLPSSGPWYWTVVARDEEGAAAYADTGMFFIEGSKSPPPVPSRVVVFPPAPNPTSGRVVLRMSLIECSIVRLELFDTGGRSVAFRSETYGPGEQSVSWAIPDRVPDGAYLLRVAINDRPYRAFLTVKR